MKKNIEIVERNSPVTKVILETLCSKTVFNLIARSNGELAKQVKIRGVWGRGHAMQQGDGNSSQIYCTCTCFAGLPYM